MKKNIVSLLFCFLFLFNFAQAQSKNIVRGRIEINDSKSQIYNFGNYRNTIFIPKDDEIDILYNDEYFESQGSATSSGYSEQNKMYISGICNKNFSNMKGRMKKIHISNITDYVSLELYHTSSRGENSFLQRIYIVAFSTDINNASKECKFFYTDGIQGVNFDIMIPENSWDVIDGKLYINLGTKISYRTTQISTSYYETTFKSSIYIPSTFIYPGNFSINVYIPNPPNGDRRIEYFFCCAKDIRGPEISLEDAYYEGQNKEKVWLPNGKTLLLNITENSSIASVKIEDSKHENDFEETFTETKELQRELKFTSPGKHELTVIATDKFSQLTRKTYVFYVDGDPGFTVELPNRPAASIHNLDDTVYLKNGHKLKLDVKIPEILIDKRIVINGEDYSFVYKDNDKEDLFIEINEAENFSGKVNYILNYTAPDNEIRSASFTVNVDNAKPVLEEPLVVFNQNEQGDYDSITLKFKCEDLDSGLKNIEYKYLLNSEQKKQAYISEHQDNIYSCNFNFNDVQLNRKKTNVLQVNISAKDNMENEESRIFSINIPSKLSIKACKSINNTGSKVIVQKLDLSGDVDSYEKIYLKTSLYDQDIEVNEEYLLNRKEEQLITLWKDLTSIKDIKNQISKNEYSYELPIEFGHKKIKYQLMWKLNEEDNFEYGEKEEYYLANYESQFNLRFRGKNDELKDISFDESSWAIKDNKELELDREGLLKVDFLVEELNAESSKLVLYKILDKEGKVLSPLGISNGLSREKNNSRYIENDYLLEDNWCSFNSQGFKLEEGKNNRFGIRITEGQDNLFREYYVDFTVKKNEEGFYTLKITAYNSDFNGTILTGTVNQEIQLELETNKEVEWDFGDGSKSSGKQVTHIYKQNKLRTGAVSNYELKVQVENGEFIKIPVEMYDTRFGDLYGDEEWIGEHEVLGNINVPAGINLSFKGSENKPCIVLFNEGTELRLLSQSKVIGEGKTILSGGKFSEVDFQIEEVSNKERSWKGIRLESDAYIKLKDATIRRAQRGIIAEADSFIELSNAVIEENNIGIHLFNSSRLLLQNSEIKNNSEYGVKEELYKKAKKNIQKEIENSMVHNNLINWGSQGLDLLAE